MKMRIGPEDLKPEFFNSNQLPTIKSNDFNLSMVRPAILKKVICVLDNSLDPNAVVTVVYQGWDDRERPRVITEADLKNLASEKRPYVVAKRADLLRENRYNELKKMLEIRRHELVVDISAADNYEDINSVLNQLRSETLIKIDAALKRLEEGTYGDCSQCNEEISLARLRALPFAVRCKDCEEAKEIAEHRERVQQSRRGMGILFE